MSHPTPDRPAPTLGTPASVRRRALVQAAVGATIGGLVWLRSPTFAAVIWSLTALVLAAALLSPGGAYAAIERVLARFGQLVGRILAVVFLVPLFFGFFLLFGLAFRRGRRDRLERRFEPGAASYWKPHRRRDREPALADYERMG